MSTLYLDLETYSDIPITYGPYKYAEGSEVLLLAFALDNEEVKVMEWDTDEGYKLFNYFIRNKVQFCAHNSNFDRVILKQHNINIPVERWRDTLVRALTHGLPGGLGLLCDIFKLPVDKAKDKEGKKLINFFCKPQKNRDGTFYRNTKLTHPDEWEKFKEYAKLDIEAMRELDKRLPRWNETETEKSYWYLDQYRNDRGFLADLDLARSALQAVAEDKVERDKRTVKATDGKVNCATQRDAMLEFILNEYGVSLPDMQASTLERRLEDENLPGEVKELIVLRLESSGTSTKKYDTFLKCACQDGRVRGTVLFSGASRTSRDCIAKGSLVTVLRNGQVMEVPIEKVLITDKVWDGEGWVNHEGVVFSGKKNIIEHDNVAATAEHIVYISTTEHTTLLEAKKKGLKLWTGQNFYT